MYQINLAAISLHRRPGGLFWLSSRTHRSGSVMTENRAYRNLLIEFHPKSFVKRNHEYLTLLLRGRFGRSVVGRITIFLLKVAALEIIRRFSKRRCPCVWRGLQALQILCYPPFKCIQRWAPFKALVDNMQVRYINLWTFYQSLSE